MIGIPDKSMYMGPTTSSILNLVYSASTVKEKAEEQPSLRVLPLPDYLPQRPHKSLQHNQGASLFVLLSGVCDLLEVSVLGSTLRSLMV